MRCVPHTLVVALSTLARADLSAFAANHRADFERWLTELVNLPSVSVDPAHADDVRRCAEAARDLLQNVGGTAELLETGGNPLVHARLTDHPGAPTVTLYNHLDVQ